MKSVDAKYIKPLQMETFDELNKWIKQNPMTAIMGIYPDNGKYLVVTMKLAENEVSEPKGKEYAVPAIGNFEGMKGEVIKIDDRDGSITLRFENGTQGLYFRNELMYV